eukprot:1129590-Pelagomonas_calceolata.AAC.1
MPIPYKNQRSWQPPLSLGLNFLACTTFCPDRSCLLRFHIFHLSREERLAAVGVNWRKATFIYILAILTIILKDFTQGDNPRTAERGARTAKNAACTRGHGARTDQEACIAPRTVHARTGHAVPRTDTEAPRTGGSCCTYCGQNAVGRTLHALRNNALTRLPPALTLMLALALLHTALTLRHTLTNEHALTNRHARSRLHPALNMPTLALEHALILHGLGRLHPALTLENLTLGVPHPELGVLQPAQGMHALSMHALSMKHPH